MSTNTIIWIIVGCALVTWFPRIIPFIFVRNVKLPDILLKWLSFIPICILSALVVENLLNTDQSFVSLDWPVFAAFIPTLIVAIWTKSLSTTVVVGVISMAAIRYLL
ncbi:AzlD domain-containing protein [Rummeliibacillus sp. NPDC094406]|uniref:AzlD domain-containing protein n=1 Tax=Rummeliibacillus sp. NPDC094406 TaxID=3364511 RepID=UPI0037FEC537